MARSGVIPEANISSVACFTRPALLSPRLRMGTLTTQVIYSVVGRVQNAL